MRQLMHGNCSSRRAGVVEIFGPDFVVAREIVHVDEVARDLDTVGERCALGGEDVTDVFDNGARLLANVEVCRAHRIDLNARKRVVLAPRTRARNEQKIASAFDVREAPAWRGFVVERGDGHVERRALLGLVGTNV